MPLPPLPTEYSASLVRSDGDRSRVYLRDDRRRVEASFSTGQRLITITRGDIGIGWIWQDADPWIETRIDWQQVSNDVDPSHRLVWTEVGQAEIDGEACARFQGFADKRNGPLQEECFILPSGIRRRTITYRTDGSVGIVVDCLEVKLGPPALAVFELPEHAEVRQISGGRNKRRKSRPS